MEITIDDTCYLCQRYFKHKRRVVGDDNEIEIVVHCKRCRAVFRRKKILEQKLLDVEWILFGLQHHTDYFDDD